MFRIPIFGEVNGRRVKINIGDRYILTTINNSYEGTITDCDGTSFLIKTVDGGFRVDFNDIENVERAVRYDVLEEVLSR